MGRLKKLFAAPAPSKSDFPDGIKQLHPPSGTAMEDAEVDICFVHGLTGDREKTWTAEGQLAPWPQTLLPSSFPKARILTFGYDAYVVQSGVASSNGLDNHANTLLNDIVADRREHHAKARPLIFVAHSLGGIVCKQAISFSRSSKFEHLHDVYDSVIGIAFMGTPHRGSSLANWADIPVTTLGVVKSVNKKLTDVLHIGDPLLVRTYNEFLDALAERQKHGRGIHIVCFYEELPIFRQLKVVTEHSATMDGDIAIPIHANHMDMVRFADKDGRGFTRLRQELARWIEDSHAPNSEAPFKDPMDKECIQNLCLTDPDDDRTRIEKKNGTFFENIHDWVFANDAYKQWRDGNPQSRLLWIRGDPGKGKTMILCSIIRNLKDSGTPLSYFFCQATNGELNHATAVLRGLIYIFVKRQPALIAHIRKKYDHKGKRLFEDVNAWEALSKIFTDIINDKRLAEAVVLVDGLDECTEGRTQLLELIAQPSQIRWLVSSRNWPDIQESFRGAEQKTELRLELNPDAIARAVDAYVRLKVNQLAAKKRLGQETRDSVEQHLLANADGTFLWVALVCHALEGVERRRVPEKVASFPHGLSALYGRMVQTIQAADNADECCEILAIASTVYRPITLPELQVLWPSLAGLDREDLEDAVQLCGSFLTLRDDTLYFVHQSAKDYLVGEAQPEIFPRGLPDQHHAIASRSLAAMSNILRRDMYGLRHPGYAIEEVRPPADNPLAPIAYSCLFWVDHLADAETAQRDASLQDGNEVHRFFLERYLYWLEALSLLRNVWAGVIAVRKLNTMINGKRQDLASFLYDAQRFISSYAHAIVIAPLQTYASALLFSPTNSMVRRQFAKEEPDWVIIKPEVPENWDACEQTLEGHSGNVKTVAFSPDGQKLASGSLDGTVKVWDIFSGQCTHTLEGHIQWVNTVTFSPDSQKLASSSVDKTIKIWDLTGQPTRTLKGDTASISSVAFSPSGQKLASGSYDNTVKVWDLTGQPTRTLKGHTGSVDSVAFSPSGQKLASGSYDNTVKVWDLTGQPTRTLEGHTSPVESVAFSPSGQKLASGANDHTVKVWDMVSGQCMHTLEGHTSSVESVAFSPSGQKLASDSYNHTAKVWDMMLGQFMPPLEGQFNHVLVAFSSDGQKLASASKCMGVKVWDETVQPIQTLQIQDRSVMSVAFSPDGQKLASGSTDYTVKVWNIASKISQSLNGHDSELIWSLAVSPGGRYLASASPAGRVKIWEPATGQLVHTLNRFEGRIHSLTFSAEGQYLAWGSSGGNVYVYNVTTGELHAQIFQETSTTLAFSPVGQYLAYFSSSETVTVWAVATGQLMRELTVTDLQSWGNEKVIALSPGGRYLALCSGRWDVKIWHVETGQRVQMLPVELSVDSSMTFSLDGQYIAFVSDRIMPSIWNLATGELMQTLTQSAAMSLSSWGDQHFRGPLLPFYNLDSSRSWITAGGRNLLWLPSDYRTHRFVSEGEVVGIGTERGRLLYICFAPERRASFDHP